MGALGAGEILVLAIVIGAPIAVVAVVVMMARGAAARRD